MSDFDTLIFPNARKAHQCEWCGGKISKGETHAHFKGKWQGDFQDWRMHGDCYYYAYESDGLADGFEPYSNKRP